MASLKRDFALLKTLVTRAVTRSSEKQQRLFDAWRVYAWKRKRARAAKRRAEALLQRKNSNLLQSVFAAMHRSARAHK